MASAAEMKARVVAYVTRLQQDRDEAAAKYADELRRLDAQIVAANKVLAAWDGKVDTLIGLLSAAGIQVNV